MRRRRTSPAAAAPQDPSTAELRLGARVRAQIRKRRQGVHAVAAVCARARLTSARAILVNKAAKAPTHHKTLIAASPRARLSLFRDFTILPNETYRAVNLITIAANCTKQIMSRLAKMESLRISTFRGMF